jgi:hypothetical protein
MASELYVETLKGLTSGANANKVIIPSGQTLDVSAGTVTGITEGITGADSWRYDTSTAVSGTTVTLTSWSRITDDSVGSIGSAMSHSSGLFTFPATGVWEVRLILSFYATSNNKFVGGYIQVTTDNGSNYDNAGYSYGHITYSAANTHTVVPVVHLFDVTDTSTHKVRFRAETAGNATVWGAGNDSITSATFIRLGDT